jgi:general L-amino acid transport system substrate-binding protein
MTMIKKLTLAAGAMLAAGLMTAPAFAQGSGSATIDAIKARGVLNCGVAGDNAMFSIPDSKGRMKGLDSDSCRAVAAAILGSGDKVKFVPLTSQNRFTALQSGEIDLLYRSTTWTLGREGNLGGLFASTNYYDGTGFLVKAASGVKSAKEMDGATICVAPGTSTELAIADYFRVNNMKFTPILIQDVNEIHNAFLSGRCDSYSTDGSSLAAFRFQQGDKAKDLVLLPEIISKEPLGGMVRKGDDKFFDVVRWTFFAGIIAEEYGVTQANVDEMLNSKIPQVRRLLGLEGDMGKAIGVDNKFAYNAIKAVGNYGEMWARDVTPFGVPRALNKLWSKGGLQYAPPMR